VTKAEAVAYAVTIGGFYGEDELESFYDCLMDTPENAPVCEIGVFRGRSTSIIFAVAETRKFRINLIDSLEMDGGTPYDDFLKMAATHPYVPYTFFPKRSTEVTPFPVCFLHVDGCHEPPYPAADCANWVPQLSKGGYAVFHDYRRPAPEDPQKETFPAIKAAVDQWIANGTLELVRIVDSQAVTRKR